MTASPEYSSDFESVPVEQCELCGGTGTYEATIKVAGIEKDVEKFCDCEAGQKREKESR